MSDSAAFEPAPTDIAIVGMACRFPGAATPRAYWNNLRAGVESIRALTAEELEAAGVPASLHARPNYVRAAAILDGYDRFDAGFFGFSPKDAAIMDPQHRHFLECAWEALEDAGHSAESFPGRIGVYAGSGMTSYFSFNVLTNPALIESVGLFLLRHTGNDKDFLTTRVSYHLDLKGPSVNVQTACSTSLVALHLACQSLLSGECDMALAGGVTILLPHGQGYLFHENEILSPDGHCRAFDARSKGTVFGSGAGVVVLRRLADALADGDQVLAIVKGSAINNDGSGKVGYLAPSVDGQAESIAEALAMAGVEPRSIGYVETHGTGTPVGDPIEVEALTQAFRGATQDKGFCAIGSVKSNIGHLDTAAGVASLIKVVQALRHRELPASLHYESPNPIIDFAASPFFVNARLAPWQSDGPRRAGVSSLGVGGTNAHVILEEAPARAASGPSRRTQLLCVSARSEAALARASDALAEALEAADAPPLADVAWTLHVGRKAHAWRRSFTASSAAEAAAVLRARDPQRVHTQKAPASAPSTAFLFPGGGAQYPRMGHDLYESEPVYRAEVDRCLALLEPELARELSQLLSASPAEREAAALALERPSRQLPALFIVEYALAKTWIALGIEPAALIGHSMGENTAACIAGVFTLEGALGLVALRGRLFERVPEGGMLSVPLAPAELEPLLGSELALAVINAPELCVASGPKQALERLERELAQRGVEASRIRIHIAAHSPLLEPILPDFRAYLRSLELSAPKIPFVSNLSGTWIRPEEATDPEYWVRHLRGTVRFADGLRTLLEGEGRLLLEVGPGNTLGSLARAVAGASIARSCFSSLRHRDEQICDQAFFLGVLGKLWCAGARPPWKALYRSEQRQRVSLPTYPFEHERHWIEPGIPQLAAEPGLGALKKLGELERWFHRPVWRERARGATATTGPQRWLLFVDGSGLSSLWMEQLEAQGHSVVTVHEGPGFKQLAPKAYAIAPEEKRDYDALIDALAQNGPMPTRIGHLWMVTESESTPPTTTFFHWIQERGFYSLLFLAQALGREPLAEPVHLAVVSNGMQALDGEALLQPAKAIVLGPARVLPQELPGLSCQSIDLVLPARASLRRSHKARAAELARLAQELGAECAAPAKECAIALRDGKRYVQELEPLALPAVNGKPAALRDGGTYVITGGLGGIGLVLARHLARTARAQLVLVARSPLPERARWNEWLAAHPESDATSHRLRQVLELEQLGARVLVLAADVANLEQMGRVLEETKRAFGQVHGLFHAAGVLEDGIAQTKTPASVDRVFTPKVHGTLLLDQLLEREPLELCVLFSSTSAQLGPAGQIDYVAANAFLDAYAQSRATHAGRRTLAIEWGVWNEVGMAAGVRARVQQPGAPSATKQGSETGHPFLGQALAGEGEERVYVAELGARTHWLLDEHRLASGEALVPGTGYLELARAALVRSGLPEQLELRDVSFIAPLHVPEGEPRSVRVRVRRDGDVHAFEIESWDGASWSTHAQGRAQALAAASAQRAEPAPTGLARAADAQPSQARHLRFGPRWQVLKSQAFGAGSALAELELGAAYAGELEQLALHPALLDIATGYALPLVEGYTAGQEFYAPLSYRRVRVHAPLAARMRSHARLAPRAAGASREIAVFDLELWSQDGRLLVEVEGFAVRRFAPGSALSLAPRANGAAARNGSAKATADASEAAGVEHSPLLALLAEGILPHEGMQALDRVLEHARAPVVCASSLDLPELIERFGTSQPRGYEAPKAQFARPKLASEYQAPRNEIETMLVQAWRELLGVDEVGIQDNFFELGGYSLIAVRLFGKVKKAYKLEFPLSVLFEAPTIELLAQRIRAELGEEEAAAASAPRQKLAHLVPMHAGRAGARPPFFLVAGMFGNVMNLRHLAAHIGDDQPFYGIQARGLDGKEAPHETFEQMAAAYIADLRALQPSGPYFIGGYSGGGIVAYEMAQQLLAAGERVGALVFLDTPLPTERLLTYPERLELHRQRLAKQGIGYFAASVKRRFANDRQRLQLLLNKPMGRLFPYELRSQNIELAFRKALTLYQLRPYAGDLLLFRPALDEANDLGDGKVVNSRGNFVDWHNGWKPWVQGAIHVHVVPGDHDNMVLEPQVRVLAPLLRQCLVEAQAQGTPQSVAAARG